MEMKKINKFLMALAAALLLVPTAFAQTDPDPKHERYEFNEEKGIGSNKYLLSSTPNEDGEYILHIENFITGKVKASTTPTDFILVLDVSGSMLYDYRTTKKAPRFIRKSDNDSQTIDIKKLRLDDGHDRNYTSYTYNGMDVAGNSVGSNAGDHRTWLNWAVAANTITDDQTVPNSTRYYYYEPDQTFYRLNKYYQNVSGNKYYIYFDRVDADGNTIADERYYVVQGADNNITVTKTMPTNITGAGQVLLKDNAGSKGYQLYRFGSRRDALKDGVDALLAKVLEENNKTDIWNGNVAKHQVSIVAFSDNNDPSDAQLTEGYSGAMNINTKVAKPFAVITDSNITSYSNWDNTSNYLGNTWINRGLKTARRLFQELQARGDQWKPLNPAGGPNRNKVMIVLTDGEPTNGRNTMGAACTESVTIKTTGSTAINGLVYSINLAPNLAYAPAFLQHLSSNYPDGRVTNANSTGGADAATYSGTGDPEGPYYVDATKMEEGLEAVFESIAAANTGALSSNMVAVDIVSDNFYLPFTSDDLEKVTMYTAECIGKKTFTVNGVEEEYLAFAEPIKVSERRALSHLWVIRNDVPAGGGTPVPTWHDLADEEGPLDIDNEIQFRVSDDDKTIIVSGFDYTDLWCGEDLFHENTRQMASTDPNAAYALPGYRGFKIIFEFPIKINPEALGGVSVPTNDNASGLYKADSQDNPLSLEAPYPKPNLPVPVKLIIKKSGLKPGESANFTVQRKLIGDTSAEYQDVMTFVLTGGASIPEIRIPNLDPAYYYKVKEGNWSWAYEGVSPEYSTENPSVKNPIVFENNPIPKTPNHAEAKATNKMQTWSASTTSTVNSK